MNKDQIFNKQIHKDDFRLRILVTDGCNKNCYHCLNDFQKKLPYATRILDPMVAQDIIRSYCLFMGSKAQVEISGGEPGTYPYLKDIVSFAKIFKAFVKVNTNGTAFQHSISKFVDCWHVGITHEEEELIPYIKKFKAQIQLVVTSKNIDRVDNIVKFYGRKFIPIKLFVDFFSEGEEKKQIEKKIVSIINKYPDFEIKSRYTGVQENRGILCQGCDKKCITLKALWVFPSGKVSPCPQGVIEPQDFYDIEYLFEGHSKE